MQRKLHRRILERYINTHTYKHKKDQSSLTKSHCLHCPSVHRIHQVCYLTLRAWKRHVGRDTQHFSQTQSQDDCRHIVISTQQIHGIRQKLSWGSVIMFWISKRKMMNWKKGGNKNKNLNIFFCDIILSGFFKESAFHTKFILWKSKKTFIFQKQKSKWFE